MLELAILIPFVLWSINEAQKNSAMNTKQNDELNQLGHSIKDVSRSLEHHMEVSEVRLESMATIIDKIWSKIE
jgi:CII-binding regulator of phage lambda lysogenization HflD